MKRTNLNIWIGVFAIVATVLAGTMSTARAHGNEIVVSGQTGVRVWVEGGDVFSGYDDVSVYLRADRDCYATLLLVDTDGYLHVLYPSSPAERAWLHGGRTYRYQACDLGFDRLDGVGIAHLYAVGSPVPFDYSYYGASVFVGGFGYRIYGDPYVACRDFYVSLLPASCRWDFVGVGWTRFYVREWVRYPSYLCSPGFGVHVRVGDSCRQCAAVYTSYRCNAASPYEAMRPLPKFKRAYASERYVAPVGRVGRVDHARGRITTVDDGSRAPRQGDMVVRGAKQAVRTPVERKVEARVDRVKVVSTSRSGEAAGKTVRTTDHKVRTPAAAERGADTRTVKRTATTAKKSGTAPQKKGAGKRVRQAQ